MSDVNPTRSVVVEMKDERRAMHEGYVFLDEKCLLLAGEILAELGRYGRLRQELLALHEVALDALRGAVLRHGLEGLQVYPPADLAAASVRRRVRSLMGVRLQEAELDAPALPAPAPVERSPRARLAGVPTPRSSPPRCRSPPRRATSSASRSNTADRCAGRGRCRT